MRMLIIEDEPAIQRQLSDYFRAQKFVVDTSDDGIDGAFRAREYDYDLVLVDIGLPNKDGISIIKELRAAGKKYPVLVLTARGNWQDKVSGLEAGADDYLVKPFSRGRTQGSRQCAHSTLNWKRSIETELWRTIP